MWNHVPEMHPGSGPPSGERGTRVRLPPPPPDASVSLIKSMSYDGSGKGENSRVLPCEFPEPTGNLGVPGVPVSQMSPRPCMTCSCPRQGRLISNLHRNSLAGPCHLWWLSSTRPVAVGLD